MVIFRISGHHRVRCSMLVLHTDDRVTFEIVFGRRRSDRMWSKGILSTNEISQSFIFYFRAALIIATPRNRTVGIRAPGAADQQTQKKFNFRNDFFRSRCAKIFHKYWMTKRTIECRPIPNENGFPVALFVLFFVNNFYPNWQLFTLASDFGCSLDIFPIAARLFFHTDHENLAMDGWISISLSVTMI